MKYAGIIKAKELLDCVEHQFFYFYCQLLLEVIFIDCVSP